MSCTDCESNEIKYKGNGSQVLFTFPFTYIDQSDVYVEIYNYSTRRWVDANDSSWLGVYSWSFANATTIEFDTAPDEPLEPEFEEFNIKITRCTSIDPLSATFYPGSAIRAQDLNDNFEQLQLAIQEGRCKVPDWLFDYLDQYYWNKYDETIYSDDEFICSDNHIPTTGAICTKLEEYVEKFDIITRAQQLTGIAEDRLGDDTIFSSSASAARHDMYQQDNKPAEPPHEQPGKQWHDAATLDHYIWDANVDAWVDMGNAGPPGLTGPYGPPGKVIVSDVPPTVYPASNDQAARPLESGDLWWDSLQVLLYVYYIDVDSAQWVAVSKTGPQGDKGNQGEPGQDGLDGGIEEAPNDGIVYGRQNETWVDVDSTLQKNLTFTAPLVNNNNVVSIDLQIINATP